MFRRQNVAGMPVIIDAIFENAHVVFQGNGSSSLFMDLQLLAYISV